MVSNTEGEFLNLHEFIKAARLKLNAYIWDYLIGGAETETAVARNRLALDSLALRPRVLVDVSETDTSWEMFGKKIRLPVCLAPVGSLESFEAGGGASVAEAAGRYGVPMMLSSVSQPSLEDVAKAGTGPKIFQLYVRGDQSFIDDHVHRAIDAGYDAFCLTVDTAHYSRRERDIAKRFRKPWRAGADEARDWQARLSWANVADYKSKFKLPLILKGIATHEDARVAVDHGVDVIHVSNHGGRQLDHGRGTMDILPEIVDAVAGRAKIWIDGGFSRGSDLLKAIAMGADLIVLGRLYVYALAADGAQGVVTMLDILEDEVHECLALAGVSRFAELDRSFVHAAPSVVTPGVHSAFPLLRFGEGY